MTRRTTLFVVCAFEIGLLLFVAAWSARAHECILEDNTAAAIMTYNACKNDLATGAAGHNQSSSFVPTKHWVIAGMSKLLDQADMFFQQSPQRGWTKKQDCEAFLASRVEPGESLTNTGDHLFISRGTLMQTVRKCVLVFVDK